MGARSKGKRRKGESYHIADFFLEHRPEHITLSLLSSTLDRFEIHLPNLTCETAISKQLKAPDSDWRKRIPSLEVLVHMMGIPFSSKPYQQARRAAGLPPHVPHGLWETLLPMIEEAPITLYDFSFPDHTIDALAISEHIRKQTQFKASLEQGELPFDEMDTTKYG